MGAACAPFEDGREAGRCVLAVCKGDRNVWALRVLFSRMARRWDAVSRLCSTGDKNVWTLGVLYAGNDSAGNFIMCCV